MAQSSRDPMGVFMPRTITAILTRDERDELVRALVLMSQANLALNDKFPMSLTKTLAKLAIATDGPAITVGVHGGLVQWVIGNPFPVRICDYDGNENELPCVDERDQRCNMWVAPADENWSSEEWRRLPE